LEGYTDRVKERERERVIVIELQKREKGEKEV